MNYFIFDGESSLNYGVYIGGQNTFNAPQRDVSKVAIPGRNGDLIQDNGRFLNVQVPYNIVVMDEFKDKTDAIKAWLLSKKGYCKLVDTYHPGTYRMARVAGGIDFETAAYNLTGKTQVIFDCKPERFLDSGDDVFQVGVWGQTESASGDLVTFEGNEYEAFRSIAASISPTQDLHGYDYPWPAGGGKNKYDHSTMGTIGSGSGTKTANGFTMVPMTSGQQPEIANMNFEWNADATSFSVSFDIWASENETKVTFDGQPDALYTAGTSFADKPITVSTTKRRVSYSGNILNGTTRFRLFRLNSNGNATTATIYVENIQFEFSASATDYEPYSNICPITGRTEATVWRTGKNLLDVSGRTVTPIAENDTTIYMEHCTITKNGETLTAVVNGEWSKAWFAMDTFQMIDGQQYTFSAQFLNPSEGIIGLGYYDGTTWRGVKTSMETSVRMSIQFVYDSSIPNFVLALIFNNTRTNTGNTIIANDIMLETGAVATPYSPYSGSSYPVSWQSEAGTVYGGTVDVVSGVLTVDKVGIVLNGSENWTQYGKEGYYLPLHTMKKSRNYEGEILCDKLPTFRSSYAEDYYNAAYGITGCTNTTSADNNYIYIKGGEIVATSAATIKAWLAENPIQVVYRLATPRTYQLTGEEIEVLVGTNNVWADIGSVDVEWSINPHIVRNPTRFASKPKMRVKGSGNGTVTVENGTITISNLNEYVDIDSELMNCYKGTANKNADVALPYHEYPELKPGGNYIDFSGGITGVEVKGRWWTI